MVKSWVTPFAARWLRLQQKEMGTPQVLPGLQEFYICFATREEVESMSWWEGNEKDIDMIVRATGHKEGWDAPGSASAPGAAAGADHNFNTIA